MLTVKNLAVKYHQFTAVKDINFEVKRGEFFGIVGPNGSGKSTILKAINGLLTYQGEIMLDGKDVQSLSSSERARHIAVLPQHIDLSFSFNVKEMIKMGRYAHQKGLLKTWHAQDEETVEAAMRLTSVEHLAVRDISALSGGEMQRVFLARAIVQQPQLLLLDEPTNHLDAAQQMKLLERIYNLSKSEDLTIIGIFHDLNIAGLFCDRLLMLKDGSVQTIAAPETALNEPLLANIYESALIRRDHPKIPAPAINMQRKIDSAPLACTRKLDKERGWIIDCRPSVKFFGNTGLKNMFEWKKAILIGEQQRDCQNTLHVILNVNDDIANIEWIESASGPYSEKIYIGKCRGKLQFVIVLMDGAVSEMDYLKLFQWITSFISQSQAAPSVDIPILIGSAMQNKIEKIDCTLTWLKRILEKEC
ncbi:ABC-type cobalamin/Fe3+-siderophores transport system ATPase subunit [Scopulibacillus daqui]|uniref:ABC-type cobalamin/Fe3+-siderophores transport system ATPase subunit n=1 Tax=Scopulibacillus daqui TaxID=1469162 RepID=A0ABS2PZ51_9BACL|nr:ABC transporter ATP-binding protein [Scopulibacillus daqui]MBM7645331.1 ABC-type cobalamin/Fe3+-siderophores transport system ATPase subunit [Scopulibacillus daqui]